MISSQEIERMKRDSHFDPLRVRLREQADTLRRISETIGRYLSSPAQCSVEAALKFQNKIQAAAPVRQLHDAQAERVFQAVVYAYEGREVPTDLLNHGMVRRAMKFRAAAAVPSSPAQPASTRTLAALDELAAKPELRFKGWDTYGSEPLDDRAIAAVRTFLSYPWAVVPCADGGIQLEMHHSCMDMEIEFNADGSIETAYAETVADQLAALPPSSPVADSPTWLKGRCWTCGEAKNHGWHGTPRGLGPGVLKTDFHTFVPMPKLSAPSPSGGAAKEHEPRGDR